MARQARLASRDPGLVPADGPGRTADPRLAQLADLRTLPVAGRLVGKVEGSTAVVLTWPRQSGVAA